MQPWPTQLLCVPLRGTSQQATCTNMRLPRAPPNLLMAYHWPRVMVASAGVAPPHPIDQPPSRAVPCRGTQAVDACFPAWQCMHICTSPSSDMSAAREGGPKGIKLPVAPRLTPNGERSTGAKMLLSLKAGGLDPLPGCSDWRQVGAMFSAEPHSPQEATALAGKLLR